MMVLGAFFVNIVTTLVFFLRNPKEYKWYELVLSLVITTSLIIGAKAIVEHSAVTFTEHWGETIVSVFEEEPWNEWITKTCSEQYACGTTTDANGNSTTQYCTRYYDCSYQDNHSPRWYCKTDLGNTYYMTEKYHDELVKLYGTTKNVIKTRNNHSSNSKCSGSDGTKFQGQRVGRTSNVYKTNWNKIEDTRKGVFTKHKYENRIKSADITLFDISLVTDEEADSLGLFDYPEKIDKYKCPVFLGGNVSEETQDVFRRLNAKFGPSNQFKLWILVFENKPLSIAHMQENYWVKGNKNELIVCIGINDKKEITWSHSFSWATSNILTVEVKAEVMNLFEYTIETKTGQKLPAAIPLNTETKKMVSEMTGLDTNMLPPVLPLGKLGITANDVSRVVKSKSPMFNDATLYEYYKYLDDNLNKFTRREFAEFSYLKVEPKRMHIILIYILALVVSVGLNLWFSMNDLNDKDNNRRRYR